MSLAVSHGITLYVNKVYNTHSNLTKWSLLVKWRYQNMELGHTIQENKVYNEC